MGALVLSGEAAKREKRGRRASTISHTFRLTNQEKRKTSRSLRYLLSFFKI